MHRKFAVAALHSLEAAVSFNPTLANHLRRFFNEPELSEEGWVMLRAEFYDYFQPQTIESEVVPAPANDAAQGETVPITIVPPASLIHQGATQEPNPPNAAPDDSPAPSSLSTGPERSLQAAPSPESANHPGREVAN